MRRALPIVVLLLCSAAAVVLAEDDLIGADACRSCHPQAYAQWARTPHAKTFDRLMGAERTDPKCTSCHATNAKRGLVGVQCESCHGPGRHYWPANIMKDRELAKAVGLRTGAEPETCVRCHTADQPSLRPFDHAAALRAVRHRPNGGR